VTVLCFFVLVSKLNSLGQEIEVGAALELDQFDENKSKSILSEVNFIQTNFVKLCSSLNAFSKYVPLPVVKTLSHNGTLAVLGMYPTLTTVSFTDIANFTTLCHHVKPDSLAHIISIFFEIMTNIVMAYRGVVDKYVGDCIMVLWGAPKKIESPNLRALCAALAMDRATRFTALKKAFLLGGQALTIRTGIHTGECLAGNMGTTERLSYTVIGDTVNTAARLEAANKDFGTRILVSEDVANATEDGMAELAFRLITNMRVVGRETPVRVYEVMGLKSTEVDDTHSDLVVSNVHSDDAQEDAPKGPPPPPFVAQEDVSPAVPKGELRVPVERKRLSRLSSNRSRRSSVSPPRTPVFAAQEDYDEDVETSEILIRARTMCRLLSRQELLEAAEFSAAVDRYVQRDFDEALPLLQDALAKAASQDDVRLLGLMIKDCQGPRLGIVQGVHK